MFGFQAGQSVASELVRGAGFVVVVHSRFLWLRFEGVFGSELLYRASASSLAWVRVCCGFIAAVC